MVKTSGYECLFLDEFLKCLSKCSKSVLINTEIIQAKKQTLFLYLNKGSKIYYNLILYQTNVNSDSCQAYVESINMVKTSGCECLFLDEFLKCLFNCSKVF